MDMKFMDNTKKRKLLFETTENEKQEEEVFFDG